MNKETLSEKICQYEFIANPYNWIHKEDVKEFIKWVEEEIILKNPNSRRNLIKLKNKAGEELIK